MKMAIQRSKIKDSITAVNIKKPHSGFRTSISGILKITSVFGLFPVYGLRSKHLSSLRYRKYSLLTFLSVFLILTLLWASVLSLIHSVHSVIRVAKGKTGSFANATAGGIFYINNAISAILFNRIAKGWPNIMNRWEKIEIKSPYRARTKAKIYFLSIVIFLCAFCEHVLSIFIHTSNCRRDITADNSTLQSCLREYSLNSHSFIFDSVSYSLPVGLFVFYVSNVATITWNFQDLFLMLIPLGLVAQFRHANDLIVKVDLKTTRPSDWRFIRELYADCSELAHKLRKLLARLILLSFVNNLYFICLQMLNGLKPKSSGIIENLYFFGSFLFMTARLVCVTLITAQLPLESKKALLHLRNCPYNAYCSEVERLTQQIANDDISFSGLGFFKISRNFMLGMLGAIATYEVILLQFDMN